MKNINSLPARIAIPIVLAIIVILSDWCSSHSHDAKPPSHEDAAIREFKLAFFECSVSKTKDEKIYSCWIQQRLTW
jgi:hypothetical protein